MLSQNEEREEMGDVKMVAVAVRNDRELSAPGCRD